MIQVILVVKPGWLKWSFLWNQYSSWLWNTHCYQSYGQGGRSVQLLCRSFGRHVIHRKLNRYCYWSSPTLHAAESVLRLFIIILSVLTWCQKQACAGVDVSFGGYERQRMMNLDSTLTEHLSCLSTSRNHNNLLATIHCSNFYWPWPRRFPIVKRISQQEWNVRSTEIQL